MAATTKTVTAAIVVIGNEVLSGRTRDANVQFLGERLGALGIRLIEVRIIADVEATIIEAVNELRTRHDYVFTTGGIGPTHDDITAAAIAKAFARPYGRNAEAEARLRAHYRAEDVTEARLKMADMPEGATLLDNPVSAAPGFRIDNVFVLPGVPRIMQAMFDGFKDTLLGGAPVQSRAITSAMPEGVMAKRLGEIQTRYPDVEMGSYPFVRHGRVGTVLVARAADGARIDAAADDIRAMIRDLGGEAMEE